MSDAEFISKYIADASGNDLNPIEAAKSEISTIDETLNNAEKLKIRRMKLVSVLDHLGDDTYRRRRSGFVPSGEDVDISDDEKIEKILKVIKEIIIRKGPISIRDLILEVGGYDLDTLVMRAVKLLGDQDIISRDDQKRVQINRV
jgi:hypothetical protein